MLDYVINLGNPECQVTVTPSLAYNQLEAHTIARNGHIFIFETKNVYWYMTQCSQY